MEKSTRKFIFYMKIYLENSIIIKFLYLGELKYAKKNNIYIGKNYSIINNAVKNKKLRKINQNFGDYVSKKVNIISVCRLVEQKNIFEIFGIAKILKNYNFFVLGGGDLLDKANSFLKEQNIFNVYLLGEKKRCF